MVMIAQDTNLKPGYKRTEIGVIPEEWGVETLGSITTLLTNGFVGKATDFYTESDDGVLYIQGYNVEEGTFNLHGIKRVSWKFHAQHQKSCLQTGDLLTIQTGDIGVTTIVPHELAGANCHALVISRLDKRFYVPQYYCQYFNSKHGRDAFKEIEIGSTMKHLNVGDMKKLFLPSPPRPEQRAIATALSDVDSLITSLDRLIAKKRDIKQAMTQQLLTGKTRLPGFSGELKPTYKQTEIGMIPEDWEVKTVEEIAIVRGGKRLPAGKTLSNSPTPYPYIRITDMFYGGVSLDEIKYVPIEVFPSIKNYRIYKDDIFVTVAGTLGIVGKIPPELNGANLTENADRISNINCDGDYLLYTLMSPRIQRTIESEETVSAQPKLALNRIEKFRIALPTNKAEQQSIATILSDMDAEIVALEQKRDKIRALKQGMMQELLTGKTRLV